MGPVDLPDPGHIGCTGKVPIGGKDRVLVANEAHRAGLLRPGPVHPFLVGQGVQDSRQRNGGEPGGCKSGKAAPPVPECRQPRRQVGSDEQPEGNDGKDETVLFVVLQGMEQQDQGDQPQQESVAPRAAQCRCQAKQAQSQARQCEPQEELVGWTLTGTNRIEHDVVADVGDVGVEQAAIPGDSVENADGGGEPAGCQCEMNPLLRAQKHDSQQQQRSRCVLQPYGCREDREKGRRPNRAGIVHRAPRAERQQSHQRRGCYELGHGLVGEADRFVPESACQQGCSPGGFAEVASAKDVHARWNRQGNGAEQQLDAGNVPERLAKAHGVEQQKDAGDDSGHQPGARPVEVLPVGDAAAEDQAVRGFQVLHDLVGVQDEVAGESHPSSGCKGQRQQQGQILPGSVGGLRMQQGLEGQLYALQDGLRGGSLRSTPAFSFLLPLGHFPEAPIAGVPECRR